MVAYQGEVKFEHAGSGGLSRMMKKMATGEGMKLMKLSGTGEVFLADHAQEVHLVRLADDRITVASENLLAFEAGIDWNIRKVEGASGVMAGGLFNLELNGTGYGGAAVRTARRCCSSWTATPTFADPQAAITWSGGVKHLDQDRHRPQDADRPRPPARASRWPSRARAGCWIQPSEGSRRRGSRASGGGLGNILGG